MNNISYVFAKKLVDQQQQVKLFIDAPTNKLLDRPEAFDSSISCPYPQWIEDISSLTKNKILFLIKLSYPKFFLKKLISNLNKHNIVVFNSDWIKLAKYIESDKKVVILFSGYDLDVSANEKMQQYLTKNFIDRNTKLAFVKPLISLYYKQSIKLQQQGIRRADKVNYYITGINPEGDSLLNNIMNNKKFQRLELRGYPTEKFQYTMPSQSKVLHILNFTRFFYTTNDRNDNKRNDIMILGIADFIKQNKVSKDDVHITFFEKGEDLQKAKLLIKEVGIADYITWKLPVSQSEINEEIIKSDIVFDQLGKQWLGYGIVAMLYGRAVIANAQPLIYKKAVGEAPPICQAENILEVCNWLTKIYFDRSIIEKIGKESSDYIRKYYAIDHTTNFILED